MSSTGTHPRLVVRYENGKPRLEESRQEAPNRNRQEDRPPSSNSGGASPVAPDKGQVIPPPLEEPNAPPESAFTAPKTILALLVFLGVLLVQVFYFMGVGFNRVDDNITWVIPLNVGMALLVCLMQPMLIFCFIASFFPFSSAGLELEVGVVTLNPYSLGIMLMVPIGLLHKTVHNHRLPLHGSDLCLLLACMLLMVSTLLGENLIRGGFIAFNAVFIPVLAMLCIRLMVQNEMEYGLLVRVMLAMILLFGAIAISFYAQTGTRVTPLNTRPISAASCLVLAIFYYALGKYYPRPFRIAAFLFCLLGFALTFSRVFTLVMLLSPLMYLAIKRGKAFLLFLGFFAGTLVLTIFLVAAADMFRPQSYTYKEGLHKSSERLTDTDDMHLALYGRILTYKQGLDAFLERPFVGTGPRPSFTATGTTQHNFTVEWLEYGGLIGYILFVGFFLLHVKRVGALARDDLYLRINLLVLIAVMANAFFNGIMHGLMPYVAFTAIGLSEARYPLVRRRLEEQEKEQAARDETAQKTQNVPQRKGLRYEFSVR
jgi:hypothetical protein